MDFGANKTPFEIIKKGAFEGTYFRDIYSGVYGIESHEKILWVKEYWSKFLLLKLLCC